MSLRKTKPLKRSFGRRKPKIAFYIFCEGRNTEPEYFQALMRRYRSALIELTVYRGVGVPRTLADKAREKKRELGPRRKGKKRSSRFESYEENDQVWICFDQDDHPKIGEAFEICRANDVGVAFSNPCFELWIILHREKFDRICGRVDVQRRLAKLCPDYNVNGGKTLNFETILDNLEMAISRAKELCISREKEGAPFGCCSTTVGQLVSEILSADKLNS